MSAIFLANKIREQDPKAKICFLTATQRSMKNLEKHDWHWVKQSIEDYFIQMSVDMEDLLKKLTSIRISNT